MDGNETRKNIKNEHQKRYSPFLPEFVVSVCDRGYFYQTCVYYIVRDSSSEGAVARYTVYTIDVATRCSANFLSPNIEKQIWKEK